MKNETNEVKYEIDCKITTDAVLFFDLDGTLIYTDEANFLSFNKAIRSVTSKDYNLTYNPNERLNRSKLKNAIPNLSKIQYERIIKKKEEYYKDFLYKTKLNPVIASILSKYSKTNKTVLITNCREERALTVLNHFGLVDKFSNIFYCQLMNNNEKMNKFQYAISELGVQPNLVIAFENEEIEIADAKQAGIEIINPQVI
ncbi:HAD hydrolase-like protein [Pedobacter sp. ISL-68]|uniref:HAD family hydrolase n=1 Tax=unclassified Pedobacter TaxID=2628915 RepID=UPI001BEBD442|nr:MULTISPECIES: HAD hydrolase-like protein [unclassified Pedobacter]MBT2563033.1 HAD hydrolase-like protein [Pedobacter sp. ISL-64]MBT2593037.1 HAD hydrolase-like protein [Pedobacter sp. ISL-68]